jgi:DNA polymerase-3 subunit beta
VKLTIERSTLLAAMSRLSSIVPKKHGVAILSHVLIDCAEDGRVVFRGTNLDIEATVTTRSEVSQAGACCVLADTLFNIAKNAVEGADIHLELKDRLSVKSGRSRFNLATLPTADFPMFDAMPKASSVTMSAADIVGTFGRVAFAQSREASRTYLCGVHLYGSKNGLGVVATDGHRLALVERELAFTGDVSAIVSTATVAEIVRLAEAGEPIALSVSSSKVAAKTAETRIVAKLIEGTYPDFRRVIPTDNPNVVNIGREALADAVRRTTSIDDGKARSARLKIAGSTATVSARGDAGDGEDEVEVDYSGPDLLIGFNASYLLDMLTACGSDTVTGEFGADAMSPVRWKAADDASFTAVLMGLRA